MHNLHTHLSGRLRKNKGEIAYLAAQYSTPVVGFLVNIITMRFIEPDTLGAYKAVFIYSSYFSFLQLGVFNGLNRNLAYYKGKGEEKKIIMAASTGLVFALGVALLSLLIVFLLFQTSLNDGSWIVKLAFIYMGLTLFINPLKTFFDALYRTGQDFKSLGKIISFENAIYLISSFLVVILGFVGYVIQHMVRLIIGFSLRFRGKISMLSFRWDTSLIRQQINVGFLIMLNSYLYTTFFIFDEFYIANRFEKVELGYYNLARLVLFIIPIIPNSLTTIFYPKASALYGKSNDNPAVLRSFYNRALIINSLVVLPVIMILFFLIEPVTSYFLPKYINGVEYARYAMWGGLGYIMVGPSVILGVMKKTQLNFYLLIALSAISYGFFFLKILNFETIVEVILYKNILFVGYAIFIIFYTYYLTSHKYANKIS